jgi:myo-inositol-1-phosphate synthase
MAVAIDTLAYARRLREAGFTEQQADGQASALAAAMTDTLSTKQDLRELEGRLDVRFGQIDARFVQVDARFEYLERHLDTRLSELEKREELRLDARLAELQHGMTLRLGGMMVAGFGVVSILVKLL